MRVTYVSLNENRDTIVGQKVIDYGHPAFNEPTLGCIDRDTFYYIANSQWSGYTPQHTLKAETELQEVVILKSKLTSN